MTRTRYLPLAAYAWVTLNGSRPGEVIDGSEPSPQSTVSVRVSAASASSSRPVSVADSPARSFLLRARFLASGGFALATTPLNTSSASRNLKLITTVGSAVDERVNVVAVLL